jgi:superfamily II DNA or RNA helicase
MIDVLSTDIQGSERVIIGAPRDEFFKIWRSDPDKLKSLGFTLYKTPEGLWRVRRAYEAFTPVPIKPDMSFSLGNISGLQDYQVQATHGLCQAILKYGAAADLSDTGTGKTYVAIGGVCRNLGLRPFIVCPLSVIPKWFEVCAYYGVKPVAVGNYESFKGSGNKYGYLSRRYYPALIAEQVGIRTLISPTWWCNSLAEGLKILNLPLNYPQMWMRRTGRKFQEGECYHDGWFHWVGMPPDVLMIIDEAHRCKAVDSINSKMLIAAKPHKTLLLTATLATTPRELKGAGFILGLHGLRDFNDWCGERGCFKDNCNRWHVLEPEQTMAGIFKEVIPEHGVRIRIAGLKTFRENLVEARLYSMPGIDAMNKLYQDTLADIKKRAMKGAAVLGFLQQYRERVENRKASLLYELVKDYVEKGCSVALFVNYTSTRTALQVKLRTSCAVHGGQDPEVRENNILKFQSDRSRIIICQTQAGGVGISLHDITGRHPRVALISPTYSAFDLKQALGRVHRAGGRTPCFQYIVYLKGTVEEDVCRKVNSKLNNLSAMSDGDLMERDFLKLEKGTENEKNSQTAETSARQDLEKGGEQAGGGEPGGADPRGGIQPHDATDAL